MFDQEFDIQELDNVLTLCNGFKLAAIYLSTDQYILNVNSVAEHLFLLKKNKLINLSFAELCKEFGIDIFSSNKMSEIHSKYVVHWTSDSEFVNVRWDASRCLKNGECIGYLLAGKIMNTNLTSHPLEHMEQVLRAMCVGLYCKDLSGQYVFVNEHEAQIAGYPNVKGMIGTKDENAVWQEQIDFIRASDKRVLNENRSIIFHERMTLHNSKKNQITITKSPFYDKQGDVIGLIGTCVVSSQMPQYTSFTEHTDSHFLTIENGKTFLTKKEIECILWLIKGKSAYETSRIMSISKRTVECHLQNVKRKLNCYKLFQVGYLVGKYGYLLL